jgi:hypothetical protein
MDKHAEETMGAAAFVEALKSHLKLQGRQARVSVSKGMDFVKDESVYVNFINLPSGVGGAGGGAEAENNRMSFWVRGFGVDSAPPPSGKVKVELSNSALPREYKLRAKSGPPAAIAKYLADFINTVVEKVQPHFTHTVQP